MAFETLHSGTDERIAASNEVLEFSDSGPRIVQTQLPGDVADVRIALARQVRTASVAALNQILADTMTLRDLYKKHRWQTSGATFYPLHLLFDKHHEEQVALVDAIAERIQTLGGTAVAMAADVAVTTTLALPPMDREAPSLQLARLIDAHESVLYFVRAAARRASELGDDGTGDLLVGGVIRTNEKQSWFLQQHANSAAT